VSTLVESVAAFVKEKCVVGLFVGQADMKLEQRNENISVASLSPVEETSAASCGWVLKNRSCLLLWFAQLLSQAEILLGEAMPSVTLSRRKAGTLRQLRERKKVAELCKSFLNIQREHFNLELFLVPTD
jgi:hypothetical protein